MSAAVATTRSPVASWAPGRHLGGSALLVLVVAAVGLASTSPVLGAAAVALPATALLVGLCLYSPRAAVVLILVWLAVFGTIRRVLLYASNRNDPLLIVAPVVLGLLVLVATRKGAFVGQTRVTKSVILLTAVILFSALNPLQGGVGVGAAGLLFILVPPLWFWVGREILDDRLLARVLQLLSFLSLGAAIYGLFQVYKGFPWWDERWIQTKGYSALSVGTSIRPFASFASSAEYVGLLAIGTLIWALRIGRRGQTLPAILAIGILGWALTVASVRGALVIVPIALGMTLATSRGFGFGRTVLAGVAGLFVLGLAVSQFNGASVGGARTGALVSRQITGLTDPFNSKTSTLPIHVQALLTGISEGLHNPVGHGIGVITLAADKFGGANQATDIDPSNVAIAMGLPGLVAYALVVVLGLRLAFQTARNNPSFLSLAALSITLVTLMQWLNGGNYAVAPLPWLVLGWLDGRRESPNLEDEAESVLPVVSPT